MSDDEQKIDSILSELKVKPAINELLVLWDSSQRNLPYHNREHTEDVLSWAVKLAVIDNKSSDREIELLAMAAAAHDVGFIFTDVDKNETIGAEKAREVMQNYGYSESDIVLVANAVLDTELKLVDGKLKRVPTNEISRYLLDADVANFGRNDFFEKMELVFEEKNKKISRAEFLKSALNLLTSHVWFTDAAKKILDLQKTENIKKLEDLISTSS